MSTEKRVNRAMNVVGHHTKKVVKVLKKHQKAFREFRVASAKALLTAVVGPEAAAVAIPRITTRLQAVPLSDDLKRITPAALANLLEQLEELHPSSADAVRAAHEAGPKDDSLRGLPPLGDQNTTVAKAVATLKKHAKSLDDEGA